MALRVHEIGATRKVRLCRIKLNLGNGWVRGRALSAAYVSQAAWHVNALSFASALTHYVAQASGTSSLLCLNFLKLWLNRPFGSMQ